MILGIESADEDTKSPGTRFRPLAWRTECLLLVSSHWPTAFPLLLSLVLGVAAPGCLFLAPSPPTPGPVAPRSFPDP